MVFDSLGFQTPCEEVFGPKKHTEKTLNLRRYLRNLGTSRVKLGHYRSGLGMLTLRQMMHEAVDPSGHEHEVIYIYICIYIYIQRRFILPATKMYETHV